MKLSLYILFLFLSSVSFAQEYVFDHFIEYSYKYDANTAASKVIFLTNSRDNSYFSELKFKTEDTLEIRFRHHDQLIAYFEMGSVDFFGSATIQLPCATVLPRKNDFKFRTNEYYFQHFKDTVIAGKKNDYYVVRTKKTELEKNNNVIRRWFQLDEKYRFHLPLLRHPTLYEEWKKEKSIANGIPGLIIDEYYNEPKFRGLFELKTVAKMKTRFIVPEDCKHDSSTNSHVLTKFLNLKQDHNRAILD